MAKDRTRLEDVGRFLFGQVLPTGYLACRRLEERWGLVTPNEEPGELTLDVTFEPPIQLRLELEGVVRQDVVIDVEVYRVEKDGRSFVEALWVPPVPATIRTVGLLLEGRLVARRPVGAVWVQAGEEVRLTYGLTVV